MFRGKRALALGAAAAVAIGLTACSGGGGSSTSSSSTGKGGTLTLGVLAAPASWAADAVQWANASPYDQAVYDTLLHADAKTADPIPWLATSWSYNTDKTVLTLKLRTGVKFTDGSSFDASVAAQNLLRFRDGTAPDKSHLANLKDAKAVDATTLQLTLSQADPAMLGYLSQAPGLMESAKAFTSKTIATVPVGSGPYVLDTTDSVTGSKYVFTPNPNYWAKQQQYFSKVVMTVLSSAQTELNAIKGGQVDGLNIIDQSTIPQIKSTAGFTVVSQALDWKGIALLDRAGKDTPALKSVQVRQAINYAIDRKAVLKAQDLGYGTVTSSVFATSSPAYIASLDNYYTYDPAKAKQLLAAAGYSHFTLTMPRIAGFGDVSNNLIKQYLSAVGITVNFTTVPINNAIADVLAPKFSATYFSLQEDPNVFQASNFLLTKNAVFNPYHVNDPTIEKYVAEIQTGDTATVKTAAQALNTYVVQNAIMAPFYRDINAFAQGSKITAEPQAGNAYPYLYNIKPKG